MRNADPRYMSVVDIKQIWEPQNLERGYDIGGQQETVKIDALMATRQGL